MSEKKIVSFSVSHETIKILDRASKKVVKSQFVENAIKYYWENKFKQLLDELGEYHGKIL